MSWQLSFFNNYHQSGEACMQLNQHKRNRKLRCWFGPFAQQLYQQTLKKLLPLPPLNQDTCFEIEKQFAQFLLIQASFQHQRYLHQYQVSQDLNDKGLNSSNELSELLLFIRMTPQHPCLKTMQLFVDRQLPCCDDPDVLIQALLDAKLIQKICHQDLTFFDKNPYPHDHLLDLRTKQLIDLNHSNHKQNKYRMIINSF